MIFIGVGSSIGNAREIFDRVEKFLQAYNIIVIQKSDIFQNPPMGGIAKNKFSNAVWEIGYQKSNQIAWKNFSPQQAYRLLKVLQNIEKQIGRTRTKKWEDRVIDLDILCFGNLEYQSDDLEIPHPEIAKRFFVLHPWQQIVRSDFYIPQLGTIESLLSKIDSSQK